MESITSLQFTWVNFWVVALGVTVLYVALQFFSRVFAKTNLLGKSKVRVSNFIQHLLLIHEPLSLLLLASIFVLINPVFDGLIMAFFVLIGFNQLKDYASGRIIQFDNSVVVGKRLSTQNLQGVIMKKTRLGLYLKTTKGLQFISYSQLYNNGFQLLSVSKLGGYYKLRISPEESNNKINYQNQLTDLLATAPYLDRNYKTEVFPSGGNSNQFNAKVSVRQEQHLYDLMSLIREWGFSCEVNKK